MIRTLARDRRTLKGVHASGLLSMTAWFLPGFCSFCQGSGKLFALHVEEGIR